MSHITLTAADSISYPEFPHEYFSVPNDRIGTGLRDGEGLLRDGKVMREVPLKNFLSEEQEEGPWEETDKRSAHSRAVEKLFAPIPKALTYDENKAPLAYVPWAAIDEMALVQAYGHKKYKDYNNYRKGMEVGRNLSCALRHIRDYMDGIDVDAESGRSHLAHAMCRLAFVLQNLKDGTAIDDRYKQP
jgi:hypothetical protein